MLHNETQSKQEIDTTKLKNNRYFFGKFKDFGDYKGWFVGSFFDEGHPCKTDKVEVLYREHKKGDICKLYYHSKKIEIIIIIEGKARYNVNGRDVMLNTGDFIFIDINNIIKGEYLKDSKTFSIHLPSIPSDKIIVL